MSQQYTLKTKHFFPFIKMIRALRIKEELKNILSLMKENGNDLAKFDEENGIDFLFIFIEKLPDAECEVMDFVSLYTGKKLEEVGDMELEETWEILKQLFRDPKLKVFFQRALK